MNLTQSDVRDQLVQLLERVEIALTSNKDEEDIRKCITVVFSITQQNFRKMGYIELLNIIKVY